MAKLFKQISLLFAIFVLFIAAIQAQAQQCPYNQQFNQCGSACEPTCGKPPAQFCTLQCIVGCQCKPGLYRKGSDCVEQKDC